VSGVKQTHFKVRSKPVIWGKRVHSNTMKSTFKVVISLIFGKPTNQTIAFIIQSKKRMLTQISDGKNKRN